MSFEYEWTKEDLKKELYKKRLRPNIIFLILGIILYIGFMYQGIMLNFFDNLVIFIGGIVFTLFIVFILFITTKLYVIYSLSKNDKNTNNAYGVYNVKLDDKKIEVKINKEKIIYKYAEIIKFKKKKNSFYIRTKEDKIGLIFKSKVIGDDNFKKMLEYMNKYICC